MPDRIQRHRTKGWRLPPGAVIVTRPTIWGNPFTVADALAVGVRFEVVRPFVRDCFRHWLHGDRQHWMGAESDDAAARIWLCLHDLRGRDLACWCPPGRPCHADVLLEIANA